MTPQQAADAIAWEPVEWLYVFDADDRQVARFRGTSDAVDLSDELKARSGARGLFGDSVIKDHLIVHNHPQRTIAGELVAYPPHGPISQQWSNVIYERW